VNDTAVYSAKSIHELEYIMKYKLLTKYTEEDFDLRRLFVGITVLRNMRFGVEIFSDFEDLEDAVNACIASSHIPFVTGGFSNVYHNMYTWDGGFSRYPYLNSTTPVMHIQPSMFHENVAKVAKKSLYRDLQDYITLFKKGEHDFLERIEQGYMDAKEANLSSLLLDPRPR
jgi:hypothetical protein